MSKLEIMQMSHLATQSTSITVFRRLELCGTYGPPAIVATLEARMQVDGSVLLTVTTGTTEQRITVSPEGA